MSSLNLSPNELKALEQTRTRLHQLSSTLGKLKADVHRSNPLPNPSSLQAAIFILQKNLSSLLELTSANAPLFQRVAVHPSTNFPGRQQEGVLTSLLRKKLEPDIDDAVAAARARAAAAGLAPDTSFMRKPQRSPRQQIYGADEDEEYDDDDDEEDEDAPREPLGAGEDPGLGDVWRDAGRWLLERVGEFVTDEAPDVYTAEEREIGVENVRTGLKRELEEDEEDEDEDEDEVMGGVPPTATTITGQPVVQGFEPEFMLWFAAKGDLNVPRNLEIESQKKAAAARKR